MDLRKIKKLIDLLDAVETDPVTDEESLDEFLETLREDDE